MISKKLVISKDEKILANVPVVGYYRFDDQSSKIPQIYFLCFTNNCLIGIYVKRYYPFLLWQSFQGKFLKKKEKEILSFNEELKKLVNSHEYNFGVNYNDIKEIRFGWFFLLDHFDMKLDEEHNKTKIRFNFYIDNKKEIIDLFMRFLPTKTIVKK